jgi:hypothetical protein
MREAAGFALARTICIVAMQFRLQMWHKFIIKLSLRTDFDGTELAILILDNPQSLTNHFPD